MSRVIGRTDDMLIIRGVNVFPSQIEEALLRVEGTAPHYLIEVDRPGALDEVTVHVEMRPQDFSDRMSQMQTLRDRIQAHDPAGDRHLGGSGTGRSANAGALRRQGEAGAGQPAEDGVRARKDEGVTTKSDLVVNLTPRSARIVL